MKKIYLLLLSSIFLIPLNAQKINLEWAQSIGGSSSDEAKQIITDDLGNIYLTGYFTGTVDFDAGTGITTLTSNGGRDIFVQKIDANGNLLWAKSIGSNYSDGIETGTSISLDAMGNVYLTGIYWETADFDPGTGIHNLTSNGNNDFFILKLDTNGNFIWAKSIGGLDLEYPNSIVTDISGNQYLTGTFYGTVDFDPGIGIVNLTSNGTKDIFVLKLDPDGNFIWAKSLGGTNHDNGICISIDPTGNTYVSGGFNGTIDFDPGPGVHNLTVNGIEGIFVLKLDAAGNFIWAKAMGGNGNEFGFSKSIDVDNSENVFLTGVFSGFIDFDPGTSIVNLQQYRGADIFVEKLDINGNFVWARSMGGLGYDSGEAIKVHSSGNLYIGGYYSQTADFDPGTGVYNLTSNGGTDIFVEKLDETGDILWAISMGGSSSDYGYALDLATGGDLYTTGYFLGVSDFDPGTETNDLSSNGSSDFFVVKLKEDTSLGVRENQMFDKVNVFPNPAEEHVTIDFGELINPAVRLYTIQGQLIFEKKNIQERQFKLSLNRSKGLYFVEIYMDGANKISKLIKL